MMRYLLKGGTGVNGQASWHTHSRCLWITVVAMGLYDAIPRSSSWTGKRTATEGLLESKRAFSHMDLEAFKDAVV